ncbi:LysR family transcriptional regulator [Alteromonas gilva]|uniref:LysR family transcriptional regulator n=1 Tax=Alteromonas gilva TaxID=2987522 RepID=A0ABT5L3H7_9ALTE|nr:LysR family transcriptional regulator [Alteromonas gilva]MDC8831422.1 LysR family transcriptional regulator [Alteromonas gilva]
MTLEQLRMFVTVAELGSIANAAEVLHKTQPALSIAIKRFQQELQLTLLQKTANRLQLTDDGHRLLPHCRYLLRQAKDITALAAHLRDGHESTIEFAFDTICQQSTFFDAITTTQQHFPQTELYLTSVQRLGALQRLIDGKASIALTPWTHTFHELASFETLPFDRFEVIAVIHHQLVSSFASRPHSSSQLRDIPLLMPQAFDIDLDIQKVMGVVPHSTIRSNDTVSQKELLMRGAGWGYIPKKSVTDELTDGTLIPLQLDDVTSVIEGEIRLVRDKKQRKGPVASFLWQTLVNSKNQMVLPD